MQVDQGLIYSSTDLGKILKYFVPIKGNKSKLTLDAYPSLKVLAVFAKLAYSDCLGKLDLPGGWKLLTTAQNDSRANGYFGCAFWSPTEQQIVVAHRGTELKNLGAVWIDGKGIFYNKYTRHMSSAVSFTDDIKKVIQETNKRYGSRFVLSITGHSLGAWLASVTTMTVKYLKRYASGFIVCPDEGIHAHTVTLDSPGAKDMLDKICDDYDSRYDRSLCVKYLDITTFFAAVNPVNSTRKHVGGLYQLHISRDSNKSNLKLNLDTHGLEIFIKAFEEETKIYTVQDWPQGVAECKNQCHLESHCNSHILLPDAEKVVESVGLEIFLDKESTESVDRIAGTYRRKSKQQGEIPILHYKSKLSTGNTCHLGVFSSEELNFLQNWSFFQINALFTLAEINKLEFRQNLKDLPAFQMNTRIITCDTKKQLVTLIRLTKQLMRWFPEKIMEALAKQNDSIKSAPLYMAGQAYLRSLPEIMDCEDTLGLESFLKSTQRVLQIQTCNENFETARVYNILTRIRNIDLDKIYLNQNCKTVLGWNQMTDTAKVVNFEGLNKNDITNNNLLIINFESTSNNLSSNDHHLLQIILNNLLLFSHKKLVIIRSHPVDANLFLECNLPFETKALNKFELNDLTPLSRTKIFAKDAIIIGEETLSLDVLLGNDCYSNDERIRNRINRITSPILKKLTTDHQYLVKIQNNLPKLCESDALYSKVNTQVSKAKLMSLLERNGADGPLLVIISDPEQLSRDYWGEVAEATLGTIFTSRVDGRELFLRKCREEPVKLIYWMKLSAKGLILSEVYNSSMYLPRMFHSCIIIKSIDELVHYTGYQDLFIFENADDKRLLITKFNLSMEAEDLFCSSEQFITHIFYEELSMENKMGDESINKHYFQYLEIGGTPRLVWQYSHGSLDGLRPFITRDYSNPLVEGDICNMKKRVTIIADDPGVGKTISLARMSELIRDSLVLRIDNKHLAIAELPQILDLQSVVKCLIHSSGLSTDDGLARNLLKHCMKSKSSIQVCVLADAFDEITEEENKKKVIDLLMYLKNSTTCNTIVTTRVYAQKELENYLVEFSTEIKNLTEEEQDNYLVNSWVPHLALEFQGHGDPEKQSLRQFARELREEMEEVLGEDAARFMGIPLQIRMLSEVFLWQAIKSVQSPNKVMKKLKIKNLFELYTRFINVKNTIYDEQKTTIKMLPTTKRNTLCKEDKNNNYFLAFQTIVAPFAEKYFKNKILSNEVLVDLSRVGLIQANTDGTFNFIHRTFAEYFCADFCFQWLRQVKQTEENETLINIFREFLLWPCYKIIRKFIENQLETSPIQSNALEKVLIMYRNWFESPRQIFHQHDKTPLHIAAEEQNRHTLALLLSGPDNRTTEKHYIDFIAAKDSAGKTALNIALENGYLDIVNEITKNVENCSYESLLEIMLSAFLGERDDDLFREYCSNTQLLTNTSKVLRRTDKIRKQITPIIAAARDDDYGKVLKILKGTKCPVERKYLVTAMDAQGDSLFILSKRKPHWKWKHLLVKQGVRVMDTESRLIPWPPGTAGVRSDLTNYARFDIQRWQMHFDGTVHTTLLIMREFIENKFKVLIFYLMMNLILTFFIGCASITPGIIFMNIVIHLVVIYYLFSGTPFDIFILPRVPSDVNPASGVQVTLDLVILECLFLIFSGIFSLLFWFTKLWILYYFCNATLNK